MLKVLIAEDNLILADILEDCLVYGGYEVCGVASTVDDAVALAKEHDPDLAVFDFRLANQGYGSSIHSHLPAHNKMATLYVSADYLSDVLTKEHGEGFIQKPYSIDDLLTAVHIVYTLKKGRTDFPMHFPKSFHVFDDYLTTPLKKA